MTPDLKPPDEETTRRDLISVVIVMVIVAIAIVALISLVSAATI